MYNIKTKGQCLFGMLIIGITYINYLKLIVYLRTVIAENWLDQIKKIDHIINKNV